MVEHGVGIGIIPETAARRCRRSMAIRIVRIAESWTERRLLICVRNLDALPPHARSVTEHLASFGDAPE